MTISYQETAADKWVALQLGGAVGQEFAAGHTGNKELDSLSVNMASFGAKFMDGGSNQPSVFPTVLTENFTVYGVANYANTGGIYLYYQTVPITLYADYTIACNIPSGTTFVVAFATSPYTFNGTYATFDVVVSNPGGSDTFTRTTKVKNVGGTYGNVVYFKVTTTESWSNMKIEFKNFSWDASEDTSTYIRILDLSPFSSWIGALYNTGWALSDLTLQAFVQDVASEQLVENGDEVVTIPTSSLDFSGGGAVAFPFTGTKTHALAAGSSYRAAICTKGFAVSDGSNQIVDGGSLDFVPSAAALQNLIPTPELIDTVATVIPTPDMDSYAFASKATIQSGSNIDLGILYVEPSTAYTFRCRVIFEKGYAAGGITINCYDSVTGEVLDSDSVSGVDSQSGAVTQTFSFTVTSAAETYSIRCYLVVTGAVVDVDGLMLTKNSAGTPTAYVHSIIHGIPGCIGVELSSVTTGTGVQEWVTYSGFEVTGQEKMAITVNVGTVESTLPYSFTTAIETLVASFSWPADAASQRIVMADLISILQTELTAMRSQMMEIVQVNKSTKPEYADWLAAYRRIGGTGNLPENGSYRWSDNSQMQKEYTSDFVIIPGKNSSTPIVNDLLHMTGTVTRIFYQMNMADLINGGAGNYLPSVVNVNLMNGGKWVNKELCSQIDYLSSGGPITQSRKLYSGYGEYADDGYHAVNDWQITFHTPLVYSGSGTDYWYTSQIIKNNCPAISAGETTLNLPGRSFPYGLAFGSQWRYRHFEYMIGNNPRSYPVEAVTPMSLVEIYHV